MPASTLLGFLALVPVLRCGTNHAPQPGTPTLAGFTSSASDGTITAGGTVTLTARFSGGAGAITAVGADGKTTAIGQVFSGVPTAPLSPTEDTTYTLTVSLAVRPGDVLTQQAALTIHVVPATPVQPFTITLDTAVAASHQASASVPAPPAGYTILWTINPEGGTAVGPADLPTFTFDAAPSGVVELACTITNPAGGSYTATTSPADPALKLGGPTIVSFNAESTPGFFSDAAGRENALTVTNGVAISFNYVTSGGTGTLTSSGGSGTVPVQSGLINSGILTGVTPPADSVTTYTLTVQDATAGADGESNTGSVTITTVPTPSITSFATVPSPAIIGPGASRFPDLLASFSADPAATAVVDNGIGDIHEGQPSALPALAKTTTCMLTVTNGEGVQNPAADAARTTASKSLTVLVGSLATLAGVPSGEGSADGNGSEGRYLSPAGTAVDANGHVFIADTAGHTIREFLPESGEVRTIAGVEGVPGSADTAVAAGGTPTPAQFNRPMGVAVDGDGNVYVADAGNHAIRMLADQGSYFQVTTVAGIKGQPGNADSGAAGTGATFNAPGGIAFGDNLLWVADTGNNLIRQITVPGFQVTTLPSGSTTPGNYVFSGPMGVAYDSRGFLWVADTGHGQVARISVDGMLQNATTGPTGAAFSQPQGLAAASSSVLYVADAGNSVITQVNVSDPANPGFTTLGLFQQPGTADGAAPTFDHPQGVAVTSAASANTQNPAGTLWVADTGNATLRDQLPGGDWNTPSGLAGQRGAVDASGAGAGQAARLDRPRGMVLDTAGHLFVADSGSHRIRLVTLDPASHGVTAVATLAGDGTPGLVDAAAGAAGARFNGPDAVAVAASGGNLLVFAADTGNHAIRLLTVDASTLAVQSVQTLAGNGAAGLADDATGGAGARFNAPAGVAVSPAGDALYVADTLNNAIRRLVLDPATGAVQSVQTLAGDGTPGATDDPARFNAPAGVAVDAQGNVCVADTGNHLVRKLTLDPATGSLVQVSTLAGSADVAGAQDGTGAQALLDHPTAIALDQDGNLFVTNAGSSTVCVLNPAGAVTTFLGDPLRSGMAAGPLPAGLPPPWGIAVYYDPTHSFIADLLVTVDDAVLEVDFTQ